MTVAMTVEMSTGLRILASMLFLSGGLITLGFTVGLFYEALAVATGLVPTISEVTVGTVLAHRTAGFAMFLIAGVVVGALAAHFGDWMP